jgi:hypothetical protein
VRRGPCIARRGRMRSPARRLGKNGGTQSKCVDSATTGRSPTVAITLNRSSSTGCSVTEKPRPRR